MTSDDATRRATPATPDVLLGHAVAHIGEIHPQRALRLHVCPGRAAPAGPGPMPMMRLQPGPGLWSLLCAAAAALALSPPLTAMAAEDPVSAVPPIASQAPEVRMTGGPVTLPFVLFGPYPFVEASVTGVAGKLMLDTGHEGALMVNDHRVPVTGARTIGTGFFGSGQTFEKRLAPELHDVRVGTLFFPRVTDAPTQDARLLEAITPDFIGWLGYRAFADRSLKLDYRTSRATFYPRGADYLEGERVVAELAFETRKLPNHPITRGRIGTLSVVTAWDTGQTGGLFTTQAGKARLLKEGRLTPSRTEPDAYDLHGLELAGRAMPVLEGISVETGPAPAAKAIGITEADELVLGYALLRHFKTVWDFPRQRIYLLRP